LNKVALIVGCAPCWEDDLNRFKTICSEFDVFAIGLDCPYKEEIKYFVTYHIEDIEAYKRKKTGDYKIISHTNDFIKYSRERRKKPKWANTTVDIVYPHENPSGSSSLLGVKAATKKLGYEKVVLIGCPMDTGNLLNKKKSYSVFQKGWLYFKSDLIGKVKSMSGWTRELLGEPTKEWIKG